MHTYTISKMLALLFTYLSFSFLVEASPFSAVRDVAAKLSTDVVSTTSITNAGQAQCNSVGSYSCRLPSNTTIVSSPILVNTTSFSS